MARAGRRANGEGAPRQRPDGVWEVRFYVIDPRTGLRKRVSAYGKRRTDAINKMHEMVDRAQRGAPLKDAACTVGRWIEQWTETTLQVLPMSDNYREQTRNLARNHLMVGPFAERRLDQLRPTGVESLLADLSRQTKVVELGGREVETRALSDSTIRSIFLVLRKALDAAVRDGLISRNPAHEVASPRVARRKVTKLDGDDVARLLNALRTNRYYAAYALIAATGLRRGEALALGWSDVDLDARVAEVHLTLSQVPGGTRESPAKTDGSRRQVVIPETIVVLLRQWRRRQAAERLRAGKSWTGGDKVFTTPSGGVVHPRNFLRDLQTAARELGLPAGVGVHTLRHSAATAMLEAGVHVKAVADSLGHSSAQITLDIYGFTADKVARAAAEGLVTTFGITADDEPVDDEGATVVSLR